MELWIRSTSGKNLTKCDCISIIDGKEIYNKNDWEYKGYTICQCYGNSQQKSITPLGTYKSEERALEVLDDIQSILKPEFKLWIENKDCIPLDVYVYQMPFE